MNRIRGVSNYPGLELGRSSCIENSTPKTRGMEIWFKFAKFELSGVLVTD